MVCEVIPLGVGSAMPHRDRAFPSVALRREGDLMLFDCGEGTQRRMIHAGLSGPRLVAVFISHLHGDHVYGLPGLLATLALQEFEGPLLVSGPRGIRAFLDASLGLVETDPAYPLEIRELEGDLVDPVWRGEGMRVSARRLDHSVPSWGYRFQEDASPGSLDVEAARALGITAYVDFRALKAGHSVRTREAGVVSPDRVVGPEKPGRSFAYVGDTRPCEAGKLLSRDVDLMFHEATFADEHADRAEATGHSTARQAAHVARKAHARRLLLGHFSARYPDPDRLAREASGIFQNTEPAEELKRYSVTRASAPRV